MVAVVLTAGSGCPPSLIRPVTTVLNGPESPVPSPLVSTVLRAVCRLAIFRALVLSPASPVVPEAAMRVGSATTAGLTWRELMMPV